MTIPAFGTTSLNAVQTEFGGTNPIGISEYYNADPYKPVPSAGTIKLSNFRGTSSRTARITTAFSDDVEPRAGYSAYKGSMYYTEESGLDESAFGSITKTTGLITGKTVSAIVVQYPHEFSGIQLAIAQRGSGNSGWSQVNFKMIGGDEDGAELTLGRTSATYQSFSGTDPAATGWVWDYIGAHIPQWLQRLYDHMSDGNDVAVKFHT